MADAIIRLSCLFDFIKSKKSLHKKVNRLFFYVFDEVYKM